MPRWDRAAAWLPPDTRRVLDCGAAFGFGTRRVASALRCRAARRGAGAPPLVVGLEYDAGYARLARQRYPDLLFVRGSAAALPFPDGSLDAVLLLDVLEHLPPDVPALPEIWRVLRPGGILILSVPHRGPLAWADSLNLYAMMQERLPRWFLPLDPTERGFPRHRHFALADLGRLLDGGFTVERVARTGLGWAEPLNLLLLVLCRGLLRSDRLYGLVRFAYFGAFLADDLIQTGRWGYSVTIRARRLP